MKARAVTIGYFVTPQDFRVLATLNNKSSVVPEAEFKKLVTDVQETFAQAYNGHIVVREFCAAPDKA